MSELTDKVAIITGASSGIGAATAKALAAEGAKIMLAARREPRLQELQSEIEAAGGTAQYALADVTQRGQVDDLVAQTEDAFGPVDILFNNAGVMLLSTLDKTKVDEWEQMVDINIKGVMYGIAAVFPKMMQRGSGHIINNASVAGHKVFGGAAVYCATKFAVRALSEGVRMESQGKLRSTVISPGAIATELADHITDQDIKSGMEPVLKLAIAPEAIARAVVYAASQPPDVDVNEVVVRPAAQEL
jgi:NADP-dependent 3-hydroxy acid dehydrogenase YdfG